MCVEIILNHNYYIFSVPVIQTMVFNFSGRRDTEALMSKLKV